MATVGRVVSVLLVALGLFGFALVSNRVTAAAITAPMVFTALGLVGGNKVLGIFDFGVETEIIRILVEATLALVLFSDAVSIDLHVVRRDPWLPARLLGIGLPLTILSGTAVAALLFDDLTLLEAGLLAAILSPTDAALGQAVVTDERLPARLRQGLSIESGLNDGMMVPVVTVLLTLVLHETQQTATSSLRFAAEQIGYGVACGAIVGGVGGFLLHRAVEAGRVSGVYRQLGTLAVPAAAFTSASAIGGNGFIAAFLAGMVFGTQACGECRDVADFTEDEGALFTNVTFLIFGAVFAGPALAELDWRIAVYAAASLTAIRAVPVLASLLRSGAQRETRMFVAWFGPRGLASVLFALLVAEEASGPAIDTIVAVTTITVLVSVIAHGITAAPWAARLSRILESGHPDMPEMRDTPPM